MFSSVRYHYVQRTKCLRSELNTRETQHTALAHAAAAQATAA